MGSPTWVTPKFFHPHPTPVKRKGSFRSIPELHPSPLETVLQLGKGEEDSEKRNRQAGEKALDLPARSRFGGGRAKPLNNYVQTLQAYGRIAFPETRIIPPNLKCPHSKALELDCLFRPFRFFILL